MDIIDLKFNIRLHRAHSHSHYCAQTQNMNKGAGLSNKLLYKVWQKVFTLPIASNAWSGSGGGF